MMCGKGKVPLGGNDASVVAARAFGGQALAPPTLSLRRALPLILLAMFGLAACGKKGPPEPPGPPEKITYPRIYPTR
jgi:hypothetical protein